MSTPNPPYEPTDPRPRPGAGATRMSAIVYCDVNLLAFARDYGVDEATALSMAQGDVREWLTDMTARLNAEPKWQGIGTWGVKR